MINTIRLVNTFVTSHGYLLWVCVVRLFKIYSLRNFQVYNRILLSIVTVLKITFWPDIYQYTKGCILLIFSVKEVNHVGPNQKPYRKSFPCQICQITKPVPLTQTMDLVWLSWFLSPSLSIKIFCLAPRLLETRQNNRYPWFDGWEASRLSGISNTLGEELGLLFIAVPLIYYIVSGQPF